MSHITTGASLAALVAVAAVVLVLVAPATAAAPSRVGFGFDSPSIAGFPTGEVLLTGGGAYAIDGTFVHSGGGFSCLESVLQGQPQLNGCLTGEGVRWDTETVLPNTGFKCRGTAEEPLKNAATDAHTAVFQADFYRAGDGNDESFTARMIVADHDLADDILGIQNVWIQAVGCGTAKVSFSSQAS